MLFCDKEHIIKSTKIIHFKFRIRIVRHNIIIITEFVLVFSRGQFKCGYIEVVLSKMIKFALHNYAFIPIIP